MTSDDEWTVERHLVNVSDTVVGLYGRFIELAMDCGPFSYSIAKTAITLKGSRRGFAGAKPKARSLDGYFDLQRQVEDPRVTRVAPYQTSLFVHHFRVTRLDELDEQFAEWIDEAYAVGAGEHIHR